MISDAFSFKLNWDAICPAPFCMNTRKKDTRIITKVLNLLSQETIMAVKPLPPAVLGRNRMACAAYNDKACNTADSTGQSMVRRITRFTLMPA